MPRRIGELQVEGYVSSSVIPGVNICINYKCLVSISRPSLVGHSLNLNFITLFGGLT